MERKNITIDEVDFNQQYAEPFVTLDGYVYDPDTNQYSYDNDFDQDVPAILNGVKNPNQETRAQGSPGRKYFLPRQLKPVRLKPLTFWEDCQANLTEIVSAYPQLNVRLVGLGNRSAYDLTSLIVYIHSTGKRVIDIPLGEDLFSTIEKRAKSNQFAGRWKQTSKLLQCDFNLAAFRYKLEEIYSKREIHGNLIPRGKKIYSELKIGLSCDPVQKPKRKRGYSDKHSRKAQHEIHECITRNHTEVEWTRESIRPKNPWLAFLYGNSNPARIVKNESEEEKSYRKRINRQINEQRRKEQKRIKQLAGEVKIIKNN